MSDSIAHQEPWRESKPTSSASANVDTFGVSLPPKCLIESLLFVADEPVRVEALAAVLDISVEQVEEALTDLTSDYEQRGLRLQRKSNRVQLVTAPESSECVRRFLGMELSGRLSAAALETLAIVAFRQPVTRATVEAVRGVSSDSVLRTLVNYGLIEGLGRLERAGRPIVYGTTFEFLQEFGLSSLDQLPTVEGMDDAHDVAPQAGGTSR
jgi:segregation and condensation protein B